MGGVTCQPPPSSPDLHHFPSASYTISHALLSCYVSCRLQGTRTRAIDRSARSSGAATLHSRRGATGARHERSPDDQPGLRWIIPCDQRSCAHKAGAGRGVDCHTRAVSSAGVCTRTDRVNRRPSCESMMMFNRIPISALIAGCFMIAWTPTSVDARNAPARSGVAARSASADSTVVVMLGVGMPRPDPDASGPATAVVVGSRVFLFDAGPGIMRRMAAAHLPINGPTALFITHLHSDHTLGLPDLIFTSWVMGRKNALEAYGPHGLQEMTTHILEAWKVDEDVRTNGLEHEPASGYAVNVHEISPGVVYDSGGVRITAIPVLHGSLREAYAYRIDTPTRSV